MKTLVGIISGLLLVVAVAVFAPRDASAHARFGVGFNGINLVVVGCVDDEVADTLIASGKFILNPGSIGCLDDFDHTSIIRVLPAEFPN